MDDREWIERLVKVETKVDNIETVAVRMESKLDAWAANYVPRPEMNEMFRARDEQIELMRDEIKTMRTEKSTEQLTEKTSSKSNLATWAYVIVSIVTVVISSVALFHK